LQILLNHKERREIYFLTGFTGFTGFFCLSPFPEEREKKQSAFGGRTQFFYINMLLIHTPRGMAFAPVE
jgi:hypothetical protein